jgi:hypothetical protein
VPGAAGSDVSETADDDEELEFVEEKEDVKETEDMEKDDEIVATESGTDEAVKESEKSHPMPEETEKVVEEEEIFDNSNDKKETTSAEENLAVASDIVMNEPVEESFVESEENTPFAETQETLTLVASQFGDEDFDDALEDTMEEMKNADEDATDEVYENSQFSQTQFENTCDERFSQSNVTNMETSFEVEELSQEDGNEKNEQDNYMNLGQTQGEPSQLSMEY